MRVALFYNLAFGGAKRVVFEHAKGLWKRGHLIYLYTVNKEDDFLDPSKYCEHIYNYNFEISSKLPVFRRFIIDYKNFFKLKKLEKKIAKDIDSGKYDVVLVHPDKFTQAPFILSFLKTPTVYYCQEPLRIVHEYSLRLKEKVNFVKKLYEEATRLYRKKIDRDNVRASTLTIASCYHIRERMIQAYEVYPRVVYPGVDEKVFHPAKTKKINQVFFVGSPEVFEDGYDLVNSALKLIPHSSRPKLKMVSWRKKNGQRLTDKEVVKIYNQSAVTLCSSRLETFGLVPLESMACGTPVIATNVSGHRETINDGNTGYLVDFEPREIAEKIIFLRNNPMISKTMGENGRKWIEKSWTWEKQIKTLDMYLREFVARKK